MGGINLKIDWCNYKAAEYACKNWHYSRTIPINKLVKVGVWEDGIFTGVVIFGLGASAHLHEQFGLLNTEVCELVRIALSKHKTPVSRIIRIALKFLKKRCPGIKVIVSFADPAEAHHGGIYQATNWIYTGKSNSTIEYFYNSGWRHKTDILKRFTPMAAKQLKTRKKQGKYRYVMPLNKKMKKQIEPLRKPYPKRPADGSNLPTR